MTNGDHKYQTILKVYATYFDYFCDSCVMVSEKSTYTIYRFIINEVKADTKTHEEL